MMKILLVDDHVAVREGVRRLFLSVPDTDIYGVGTAEEAWSAFKTLKPDVVILDIGISGTSGFHLLERFKAEDSQVKVLMLSMHTETVFATRAMQSGAYGYVSKAAPAEELLLAVARVGKGQRYIDKQIAADIATAQASAADDMFDRLTAREREILLLLGEGRNASEIAVVLGVSYKTIANTCAAMKNKLAVERSADLVRLALEMRKL